MMETKPHACGVDDTACPLHSLHTRLRRGWWPSISRSRSQACSQRGPVQPSATGSLLPSAEG